MHNPSWQKKMENGVAYLQECRSANKGSTEGGKALPIQSPAQYAQNGGCKVLGIFFADLLRLLCETADEQGQEARGRTRSIAENICSGKGPKKSTQLE